MTMQRYFYLPFLTLMYSQPSFLNAQAITLTVYPHVVRGVEKRSFEGVRNEPKNPDFLKLCLTENPDFSLMQTHSLIRT